MGLWNVPLANVFAAYGRVHLVPLGLASSGVAAFISPLCVVALADRKRGGQTSRLGPIRTMGWNVKRVWPTRPRQEGKEKGRRVEVPAFSF